VTNNKGAVIRHQPSAGDKVRFIRRRPDGYFGSDAYKFPYLPYLELDVLDYVEVDATVGNRQVIYTNLFDATLIDQLDLSTVGNVLFGSLIEIYTPRPYIDDTGNIFVSVWKDITEAIQIKNPHTEDRSHGSPVQYYVQWSPNVFGGIYFYVSGNQSQLSGTSWPNVTVHYADGTVSQEATAVNSASYDSLENATRIELTTITPDPTIAYVTLNGQDQVVSALTSTTPAYFPVNYGDVYVRLRDYATGLTNVDDVAFYYIEDPHYSDYWSSDIHVNGRIRIEDQNASIFYSF
jgi:hypothetical protein